MNYVVPLLIIVLLVYSLCRKVNAYGAFIEGASNSMPTVVRLLPYLVAMYIMVALLRASNLSQYLTVVLSCPFRLVGIPEQLAELVVLRPFSGSGSITLLEEVYRTYGVDSYISRCASVIMGSSETVFYVSAVYFANTKVVHTGAVVPIALLCNLVGCILACLLCRVM